MGIELGIYTKPDNTTTPGCVVIKQIEKDPPADWKCSGVAALIHRTPIHSPKPLFGGVLDMYYFKVELIQYNRKKSIENALNCLTPYFQRMRILSQTMQDVDSYEQAVLGFPAQDYYVAADQ